MPRPGGSSHKYDRGYLTVLGAPSLTGATRLTSEAALRIGAGLVTVQCEQRGDVYRAALPPEIMVQDDGEAVPEKTTALLGGPGGISGRHLATLLDCRDLPRVLDSAAFPEKPSAINGNPRTVLTPHQGEFEKLFGAVAGDQRSAVQSAARMSSCIVILKGPETLIAHPDGRLIFNNRPDPNLATAGTGDVLAGMIAGLLAQGVEAFWASAAAVWMHSEAAEDIGAGLIASDIATKLPETLRKIRPS